MLTEFQDTISLVSSASRIGATIRFPLLLWLLLLKDYNNLDTIHMSLPLMKDYNNLYTIHKSRHVSTLLSPHAASPTPFNQAPSLHGVQGGDGRHHLYDEGSQASHPPPESGGVKAVRV